MAGVRARAGLLEPRLGAVDLRYGSNPNPPYPTVSDALWLLWYPFTALGIALLIRLRVTRFELHRWIDGVAVMLIVLTGGFALVLQSVAEHTGQGDFATVVDFSYPVLDMILIGAILGVFALMAWRPGKVWLCSASAASIMAVADAVFAVQEARGIASGNGYTFVWTAGAVLIAYAAWTPPAPVQVPPPEMKGWRAIALPLAVQLLAVCVQIYLLAAGLEVSITDRIVTIAVLLIASLQIVVSRPREERSERSRIGAPGGRAPDATVARLGIGLRRTMTRTRIADLGEHVGEQVSIRGWVQVVRDQKRMQFLVIRDESGLAQAILGKEDPPTRAQRGRSRAGRRVRGDA